MSQEQLNALIAVSRHQAPAGLARADPLPQSTLQRTTRGQAKKSEKEAVQKYYDSLYAQQDADDRVRMQAELDSVKAQLIEARQAAATGSKRQGSSLRDSSGGVPAAVTPDQSHGNTRRQMDQAHGNGKAASAAESYKQGHQNVTDQLDNYSGTDDDYESGASSGSDVETPRSRDYPEDSAMVEGMMRSSGGGRRMSGSNRGSSSRRRGGGGGQERNARGQFVDAQMRGHSGRYKADGKPNKQSSSRSRSASPMRSRSSSPMTKRNSEGQFMDEQLVSADLWAAFMAMPNRKKNKNLASAFAGLASDIKVVTVQLPSAELNPKIKVDGSRVNDDLDRLARMFLERVGAHRVDDAKVFGQALSAHVDLLYALAKAEAARQAFIFKKTTTGSAATTASDEAYAKLQDNGKAIVQFLAAKTSQPRTVAANTESATAAYKVMIDHYRSFAEEVAIKTMDVAASPNEHGDDYVKSARKFGAIVETMLTKQR
jgi:hypothetical protein